MKIQLISPAPANARNGNSVTALRWARILRELDHDIVMKQSYDGAPCDVLIALHARRSFESIRKFHADQPDRPLIVVLTGTDLYRDIRTNTKAQRSLELATRLIVLQSRALAELEERLHAKTRVIYQSAARVNGDVPHTRNGVKVCVIGHMRPEKDPLRAALAARRLPASSRVRVIHIGRALTDPLKRRLSAELKRNPRYHWLGELPHWKTRRVLAGSHLLALTSLMEGSSNALSEAIASAVPVVASKIPGLIGTLGDDYPGYFPVRDTEALARLLLRVETDREFYRELKSRCARLFPLVDPRRERATWRELLREIF